jgi:hemoglobin-like flavoprotein
MSADLTVRPVDREVESSGRSVSARTFGEAVTPERERLVRDSWRQVEQMAEPFARVFYDHLFELDPDTQRLFASTDMEAQGRKFWQMLTEIVRVLEQPADLVTQVAALGRSHVGYGVTDDQYETVGAALLWTLEQALGAEFTPEVRDAWSEAYLIVATVMRRSAARTSAAIPAPDAPKPES